MTENNACSTSKIKELILNTRRPIVLRKFQTEWKCATQDLKTWCEDFEKAKNDLEFEKMLKLSKTNEPQWERKRLKTKMSMTDFLNYKEADEYWLALNYQTPDEIPEACKERIDFNCFGFPQLTNDYARFWLSTPNANTPCHRDTYGCNVVVQVFGSKLWLLFPPHVALTTTRLPYEESSVYCKENFYAPNAQEVADLKRFENEAYICKLEAGDVLIVPRLWWHFVESKEMSLSINAWIPLDIDREAQLEECIVKYIIETIASKESSIVMDYMLNPNQKELSAETDTLSILAYLAQNESIEETTCGENDEVKSFAYQYLSEVEVENLLKEMPNAAFVQKSSCTEYAAFLRQNSRRFLEFVGDDDDDGDDNDEACKNVANPISFIKETLINSLCDENVLKEIINEFKKRFSKS